MRRLTFTNRSILLCFSMLLLSVCGFANAGNHNTEKAKTPGTVAFVVQNTNVCPNSATTFPATVDVNVKVGGFSQLVSAQGSITWNSAVLTYNSISSFGPAGLSLSNGNFNSINSSTLLFTWTDANLTGQTLADSTVIFTIRFNVVGTFGSSTAIQLVNSPNVWECIDVNTNSSTVNLFNGNVNYDVATSIAANGPTSFCNGGNVQLNTTATGTLQWYNGTTAITGANLSSYTASASGSYTVRSTNATGCTVTSPAVTVTANPIPTPNFTVNNSNQCVNGNSFSFSNTSSIATGTMTYAWNFGDGNTSTSTNPSNTYTTPGTYTVKLVVTSNNGCKDSISKNVTVYPKPTAGFTINNNAQCVNGNSFTFTNTSAISSGTLTYSWNFGDGNTSSATSPSNVYAASGTYTVKLVVTSNNGCKDSASQVVTVYPKPAVNFNVNAANQCLSNNNFTFTNTSTISSGTMTYAWSFGDGNTSTSTSPTKSYASVGSYNVQVLATSNNGCKDSLTKAVTVNPMPTASFTVNNNAQCVNGNSFSFSNTSTISSGTMTYSWSFGDGNTSTSTSPSNVYAAAGTYTVKLVVTSNNGCKDSISQTVTVYPKPTQGFTVNNNAQCVNGNSFTFTNTSTISSGTMTYSWSFGDGNTSSATSPSNVYAAAGNYTVKLVVTSNNGCKDSISQTVTVYPKPTPGFTVNNNAQCVNGNSFTFTNTSTISSGTMTYSWSFGDGNTSSATSPSNVYAAAGTYTVKLVVTSNNGCKDSVSQTVTVYPKPTPGFTVNNNAQCVNGNSFTFSNTSTISSGTMTYSWSFGDGNTSTSTSPSNVYAAAGTYTVKLVVTSNNGCKDSVSQTVTVYPKPTPGFTVNNNAQCVNGNSFTFSNTSTISSGTMTYSWSFGDGNTSTLTSPSNVYTAAGTYTVKLVVTSNNGCKDSISQTVTVYPKPTPGFTVNNNAQCVNGNSFTFTNTSTISSGTMTYSWSFGDGNTSTLTSPSNVYTAAGTYTVKLVVTSNNGCKDSVSQTVTVYPKPTPSFTVNNNAQCVNGNSFTFTNTSTISSGTMTYSWSFGDGNTSSATSPSNVYAAAGTYTVKLVVTSNNGCKDSVSQTVTVYPKPTPGFTVNNNAQCVNGNSFTFSNTSTISSGTLTYSWSFGDGNTSTLTSPSNVYTAAGTYTVKLVVTSNNGCKDSISQTVTVYPKPTPGFTINNNAQCVNGNSFTFSNTSTISSGTMTYSWSFGDGNTSSATSPSNVYAAAGTYTVKLVVTSNNGCADSTTQTVTVYPKPNVAPITGTTTLCAGKTSQLADTTLNGVWTSLNTSVATINSASGLLTAISAGNSTVKYVVTNVFGCKDSVSTSITVNALPVLQPITGTTTLCAGKTSTLTNSTAGGTWNSYNSNVATISSTGLLTGVAAGTTTIVYTYTNSNNCTDSVSTTITINALPVVSAITGVDSVCVNATTQLSNATANGSWHSNNSAVATVSSIGLVTGIAGGVAQIVYTVTNSNNCTDSVVINVKVNALPVIAAISGNSNVCIGKSTQLSTTPNGGSWSSQNTTIASVTTTGVVSGLQVGNTNIVYTYTDATTTCTNTQQLAVTVNSLPTVAPITGNSAVCVNATTTLSNATTGGTWSSDDTTVAKVDANTGVVSGIKAGSVLIHYAVTNSNGCTNEVSTLITVNALPVLTAIAGADSLCLGNTATYFNSTANGVWTISNTAVATINSTGQLQTVAAGQTVITYVVTNSNGCIDSVQKTIKVNALPVLSAITGNTTICFGLANATTLSVTPTGGTWTSSDNTVATVNTQGLLTGLAAGTSTITYNYISSLTGCSNSTSVLATINTPAVAPIVGNSSICLNTQTTLTNATSGGTWSSSDAAVASIDANTGLLTGVSAGTATITYTIPVGNACGNSSSVVVNVNSVLQIAPITGDTTVCFGTNPQLNSNTTGGTWVSTDNTVATISAAGLVTSVTPGTSTIRYIITNGLGCSDSVSTTFTVNAVPVVNAITGADSVCLGQNITLANTTANGVWSTSSANTIVINQAGVVSALAAGVDTVHYTVTTAQNCVAKVSKLVTVNQTPSVAIITGNNSLCVGTTTQLSSTTANGVWSVNNSNVSISNSGLVTANNAGSSTVTYTLTNGSNCSDSKSFIVTVFANPTVNPISGAQSVCQGGSLVLANTTSNGTWASINTSIGTISNLGVFTALAAGVDTVTYTVTSAAGCTTVAADTIKVFGLPSAGTISGDTSICLPACGQLTSTVNAGVWTIANTSIATISATGQFCSVASGNTQVTYTVTDANNCSASVSQNVYVNALPVVAAITGNSTVTVGGTSQLANATANGVWSISTNGHATISSTGIVTGVSVGNDTVTYTVTNAGNCSASVTYPVTVVLPTYSITSITRNNANPTNAASVSYTVTFSAAITGLTAANFSLTNGGNVTGSSISNLSGSGTTYVVTVNTGTGDGTITLNLDNATALSATISNTLPFVGETYIIKKTAPNAPVVINPANGIKINGNNTPVINGTATAGDTIKIYLDGNLYAVVVADNSGNWSYTPTTAIPNGNHTVYATATDSIGNVSAASNTNGFNLPVQIVSFNAIANNGKVVVSWTTSQEINLSHYQVEYSTNGQDWTTLTKLSAGKTAYEYVHANPINGFNYYRLKAVDKDGKFMLSEVRLVTFNATVKVSIYPNPVINKRMNVVIANATSTYNYRIVSVLGKQVQQGKLNGNNQTIELQAVSAGTYWLCVEGLQPIQFIVK